MSTVSAGLRFSRELRDICGAGHVIEDPAALQGWQIFGIAPSIAVEPASADEIVEVLRFANQHGLSVVPAGGFTQQQTGNPPPQVDILLSTSRLTAVEHYDPGDLTIGIGAGCTVAQLSAMVSADGLLFAGDPAQPDRATVGGLLATGMSGPLRQGYGGLRDYCIGIHFVTGDGRKAKGGGRVVKNVAGYDLMKLLIGSRGTLAVITGASFKLFPAARQTRTFVASFGTGAEAVEFRDNVLRSPLGPICLELVSPEANTLLPGQQGNNAWSGYVRAAGSEAVLARYRTELGPAISREIDGDDEQQCWRCLTDFTHAIRTQHPDSLVMTLSLPPTEVGPALEYLAATTNTHGMQFAAIGRVGVGHLLVALWPPQHSAGSLTPVISDMHGRLSRDASLTVLSAPRNANVDTIALGRTPTHLDSMRAVKHALDPNNILNRGRFLL